MVGVDAEKSQILNQSLRKVKCSHLRLPASKMLIYKAPVFNNLSR